MAVHRRPWAVHAETYETWIRWFYRNGQLNPEGLSCSGIVSTNATITFTQDLLCI